MRIILFTALTFLFAQSNTPDPWGGYSVSNSDNFDVFNYNPSGIAIDHDWQEAVYIEPDTDGKISSSSTAFYANRVNGFGYSLKYKENDKLFNASDVNITFGSKVSKSLAFGSSWSKEKKSILTGFLYRPANFFSTGLVFDANEDLTKLKSIRYGLAIRPFSNDFLTIGSDVICRNDSTLFSPFFDISLGGAISLKSQFYTDSFEDFSFDDISLIASVNFNFGKGGLYITKANPTVKGGYGYGYFNTSQKRSNFFNKPKKNEKKFIRFNLKGLFIEEKPGKNPFFRPSLLSFSSEERGKQLKKWLDEVEKFKNDDSVEGLIIDLGSVRAGFSKRQEIYQALKAFKDSGKKIIVYAKYGISNIDYHLISMADDIYINEMTGVNLHGLSMEVTFYKQLLDTLNIVPEVFRVNIDGDSYKTAGDPFLEETATEQMKENYGELLKDLYSVFVRDISAGRSWNEEETKDIINMGPYYHSDKVVSSGLVTDIMYPDEFENHLKEMMSCKDDQDKKSKCDTKYTIVNWKEVDRSREYVSDWSPKEKNNIALIYAVGGIMPGKSQKGPSGSSVMGDETISEAIRSARQNSNIDAIVLRIDSGGGSAFASDQMWHEIELTTNNEDSTKNKPFIASMSDVAASGGYYIACNADKIIANDATVTGSIGVIGLNLNTSILWKNIGVNKEVVAKEGANADFYTTSRLRNEYETKKMEESINSIYQTFKNRVIDGRVGLTDIDKLDDIAMGRVWTGSKAQEHLLVDEIGGINDAIILAAEAAGIKDLDNINVIEYPKNDISENIKSLSDLSTQLLLNSIPIEFTAEYSKLMQIQEISESGAMMVLPYSIEIK